MFQFTGSRPSCPIYSGKGDSGLPLPGFPIRISTDLCSLATPRSISLLAASFFASWYQGIHRTPFVSWPTYKFLLIFLARELSSKFLKLKLSLLFRVSSELFLLLSSLCSFQRTYCQTGTVGDFFFTLLTTWLVFGPLKIIMVEMTGFEPATPCVQSRCSPSWATSPWWWA